MSQALTTPTRHTVGLVAIEAQEMTGARWKVTVIEAGQSVNGSVYPPETLKAAEHLFNDLPIYAYEAKPGEVNDHLPIEAPREFLAGNVAGWVRDGRWSEEAQAIVGEAEIVDPRWREELLNAHESREGRAPTRAGFGLSIICLGLKDGSTFTELVQVPCVEIVTHPAAGGRFETVLASLASKENKTMSKTTPAPAKTKENAEPAAEMLASFAEIAGWLKAFIDGAGAGLSDEQLAPLLQAHQALMDWSEMENLNDTRNKELEARVESLAGDLDSYRKLLSENAMSAAFDACGIEFHDRELALSLIDSEQVKVSDDFQSVEGLAEQLEALAEAKPFLVKQPAAESKPAEPEEKPAAESAPAKTSTSGQSVTVAESVATTPAGRFASFSREQLERKFASTHRRAMSGDSKALAEHKAIRLELQRG